MFGKIKKGKKWPLDSRRAGRGKDRGSAFAAKSIALLVETLKILRLCGSGASVSVRASPTPLYLSTSFYSPNATVRPLSQFPSIDQAKKIDLIYIVPRIPILSSSRSFMSVESTDTSLLLRCNRRHEKESVIRVLLSWHEKLAAIIFEKEFRL